MRKLFVAGNWKMNTNSRSGVELARNLSQGALDAAGSLTLAVFPPFVYLKAVGEALSGIALGSQDLYFEPDGAFTGEISVSMLKDIGCNYCLCGHSERRHVIGETDELINRKVTAAINGGLLPILCVGELLAEREAGQTNDVITRQVKEGLAGLSAEKLESVTIAYEPVWAIGTGLTATPQQAQQVHEFIRKLLAEMFDQQLAGNIRILYGGSVKPGNAEELMGQEDVDGVLVGGASLKTNDFLGIIEGALQNL